MATRDRLLSVVCAAAACTALCPPLCAPHLGAQEDESEKAAPAEISGNLSQRYRFRSSSVDDARDQDVYGFLTLDMAYPHPEARHERPYGEVGFHFQGSYDLDIDGFRSASDSRGFVPFTDVSNTFGDRFHAFLHSAYAEVADFSVLEHLRFGRQRIHREEGILFDGAHAKSKVWKTLSADLYAGVPAHLYESSPSGDLLTGVGVESTPLDGLSLGADYFFIRDRRDSAPDANDDLYAIHADYRITDEWSTNVSASWVEERDRRQLIDLRYVSKNWGSSVYGRVLRQNGIVDFLSSELSAFQLVQGSYAPFFQYQIDAHQPIAEHFGVGTGVSVRELEDSSDEGLFNHEYQNVYLSFDARDVWRGGRISLRGDLFNSDNDEIYAAGVEAEQRFAKAWRIRIGTDYSLYRFDEFTGTERDRDRLYYVKVLWKATDWLHLDSQYRYEKDSHSEYHVVTSGFRVWF